MIDTNRERWAEALKIERLHGRNAPRWIAERMNWLALLGDEIGAARFREIAVRYDQLQRGPRQ